MRDRWTKSVIERGRFLTLLLLTILTTRSASVASLLSASRRLDVFWWLRTPKGVGPFESSALVAQPELNGQSMSKAKDEMRREYRREDLGKGVRGKYLARVSKGTNLVLLNEEVAKAFPTTEAVNEALAGLLAFTQQTARITSRSTRAARKRAAG